MTPRRPDRLLTALLLALTLGLAGCGVGPTDRPVDEGDAAAGEAGSDVLLPRNAPGPNEARSAPDEVRNFLMASVGGLSAANENVKSYLTANALGAWVDPVPAENPPLSVVRIVAGPTEGASVNGRTRVTVDYQLIGTMTDQGRIDDLAPVVTRSLTFWVVLDDPTQANLRIDEIDGDWPPGALLLSNDGLETYYRMQPIYFWDMEYKLLVPDLRYVALTKKPAQRARDILQWLVAGPSNWLGAVQRLPIGSQVLDPTAPPDETTLAVNLTAAAAGTGDPESLKRLMFQIQWSLTSLSERDAAPRIELRLDDQPTQIPVSENEFRQFNRSWTFHDPASVSYDIRDRVVVPAGEGPPSPVLGVPENNNVVWAALSHSNVGAFVREVSPGRRALQIVRPGAAASSTDVPTNATMGRPSFVPGTDFVLLPTGGTNGRLLAVSTSNGSYTEVSDPLTGVTTAAVSPDGRRVAFVADGEVYVSSLRVQNNEVTLASTRRQLLGGRLDAKAVTWTSEAWLLVAGTNGASPAFWRVSSDGVLVEDLSGQLGGLSGVDDLVCDPTWKGSPRWGNRDQVEAIATTQQGVYNFRTKFEPVDSDRVKPFFAT